MIPPRQYRALSALLSYPQQELLDALPEIETLLGEADAGLTGLLAFLHEHGLIALQENYVATFDRNPAHSLHLFEHVHGESRDRGQAMVDLLDAYRQHGLEPGDEELPDFLPLFLEFLGELSAEAAQDMLGEAVHVIAAIAGRLRRNESPYAAVLEHLVAHSAVAPQPLTEPPVRDMDEAMEMFGPAPDGAEPLLKPAVQPLHFHASRPGA